MKKLLILSCLILAGCQTSYRLVATEYRVVKAPADMYDCPVIKRFPNYETLTDQEVGTLILKLQRNNITCKSSVDSIKKFYDDAEKIVAAK